MQDLCRRGTDFLEGQVSRNTQSNDRRKYSENYVGHHTYPNALPPWSGICKHWKGFHVAEPKQHRRKQRLCWAVTPPHPTIVIWGGGHGQCMTRAPDSDSPSSVLPSACALFAMSAEGSTFAEETLICRIPNPGILEKEFTFSVAFGHTAGHRGMRLYYRGRNCMPTPKGSEPREDARKDRQF